MSGTTFHSHKTTGKMIVSHTASFISLCLSTANMKTKSCQFNGNKYYTKFNLLLISSGIKF
jgi:hypothetical protein